MNDGAFGAHVALLLFIGLAQVFAYRVTRETLFLYLSVAFFINISYLSLIQALHYQNVSVHLSLLTLIPRVWFVGCIHAAVQVERQSRSQWRLNRAPLAASCGLSLMLFVAALYEGPVAEAPFFAFWAAGPSLYAVLAITSLSSRLERIFRGFPQPARLLVGGWQAYGALQLALPFSLFPSLQTPLTAIVLATICFQLIALWGLANCLIEIFAQRSLLGELANVVAGLHHDIRTPVSVLDAQLTRLQRERSTDDVIQAVLKAAKPAVAAIHAALELVSLARLSPEEAAKRFVRVRAWEPIDRALRLYRLRNPSSTLRIQPSRTTAPDTYILASPNMLCDSFINILNNAREAGASSVVITIDRDTPSKATFRFRNDGPPLSSEALKHCLEPGWTTKDGGSGEGNVGLGLYTAARIVYLHRGEIILCNLPGEGGVETAIRIPTAPASERRRSDQSPRRRGGSA